MSGISHLVDAQLASRNVEIPNRPVKSASTRSASEMPALAEVASYIAGQEAHRMTLEQLQTHLDTDAIVGLSSVNHAERLESEGPNTLSSPDATSWLGQLLQHFTAGFQLLLLMAAILCLLVYSLTPDDFRNLWLAVVLILVVISTSLFSHYQNTKSEQLLSHFELLTCKEARVVRDGEEFMVNADTLATGDLVTISSGERIPADLVLVQGSGLKVDNSTLTGESEPLPRSTECTDPSLMETKNVVFCGTFVVEGIGRGLVFQKGDKTVIGQVAQCMMVTAKPESHLKQEINLFVRAMACISVLLGLIFFIVALLIIRQDIVTAITFCIGIIIANVPEGLLPQLTIQLYITASKLRSRNVLVKNLEMVETLGCISCIACDKTGTLTQNQMATSHLMIGGVIFCAHSLSGDKYPECNYTDRGFQLLCEVAQLSSETAPNRTTGGGTTELAVVKYFAQYNNLEAHREEHRRVAILPFSSSNKWMLTICVDPETPNGVCVYMKGAPERVIERCSTAILGGETVPISSLAPQVEQCNTELCALGERVLGFAFARLDPALYPATYPFDVNTMNFPLTELCFAGLVSLVDPPRPEAAAAIRTCRKAGMKLLMVTGDHPVTAEAIARSVGILRPRPNNSSPSWNPEDVAPISEELGIVVNGEELGSYTPKDWDEALSKEGMVFARTLPQQKQMIVANLQARGHMVAVTGDGVNDSPALKQASCGIAMGSVGADIAKDAADIILLDDNFTSIVAGIKEGRVVYANMQKCIILVLSHLIPEVLPFILFITAGLPLGLNIVMLLVVDLCTDMLGAIALAWEPGETVVMDKPPRHVTDRLASYRLFLLAYLQAGALEAAMGFLIYCVIFAEYGFALGDLVGTASIWSLSDDALSDTALQKLALLASSNPLRGLPPTSSPSRRTALTPCAPSKPVGCVPSSSDRQGTS
eukprot:GGOE01054204.1.p1 GENE.GGOE01054204.1~~GGOE01054204.1.p1  ORF type:complete len:1059 (-),score=247.52 GGOE01054204.1:414-3221(-)